MLNGKEKIANYIKSLNVKGTKEKLLHGIIQSHLKCGVIDDFVENFEKPEDP